MMKMFIMIAFLVAVHSFSSATSEPNCNPHVQELGQDSGFYSLPHSRAARMFYMFFESRAEKKTDPVVLWLAGGPGCGGETPALQGNGPFQLQFDMSLLPNPYSWNMVSNLLYVDQPTGTGFSSSPDANDIRHDEESIAGDLYDFLQAFFKSHPQYTNNKFYITGESYAGHFNPALASRIQRGNREKNGIHINLKGMAIGNGWTNPLLQYKSYPDYALQMKLIGMADYEWISNSIVPKCEDSIKKCVSIGEKEDCDASDRFCESILNNITSISGVKDSDIRKKRGDSKPVQHLSKFVSQECIKNALGVGEAEYVGCASPTVMGALQRDYVTSFDAEIPPLLEEGIEVLIYVGVFDIVSNWIGSERWMKGMNWSGAQGFKDSPMRPFVVDGAKAGEVGSFGPLAFMKLYDAGHNAHSDQPKAALRMLEEWICGKITKPT